MFIGFSWLRFLSRLAKAGLGIVTFGGTLSHLTPYTFKQVGNLRPIGNRPSVAPMRCPHRLRSAAMWGSQSWLQPPFSRLSPPVRPRSSGEYVFKPADNLRLGPHTHHAIYFAPVFKNQQSR